MPEPVSDDQYCVITGCIARNLLPRPTYTGLPRTSKELYELTIPYAKVMAKRLKGRPLQVEHEDGAIGEILHSWVNENNQWFVKAVIDRTTRSGNDIILSMLSEADSPVPVQVAELSLTHQGLQPFEVSMVIQGARDGSTVDMVECVDSNGLAAIKNLDYKLDPTDEKSELPADTPVIRASFNGMANYIALRNAPTPVTYASSAYVPSEAKPILQNVQQMQEQLDQQRQAAAAGGQQQQQQQQQQAGEDDEATLLRKLQELRSKNPTQQQSQFQRLTDKLSQPGMANDPANKGNTHTLYSNPEDDKFMQIAGMFDGRNVLTKEQMEAGKGKLIDIAMQTKANREVLAKKEAELAEKNKQIELLTSRVQAHESDIEKQRKQTASLLKKLMIKTNPPASASEAKELDSFESDYVGGKPDAVQALNPFLIKASALLDQAEGVLSAGGAAGADMQANLGGGPSLVQAMRDILNPSAPLVQASGYNKRKYDEVSSSSAAASAANSHSNSMWQQQSAHLMHPMMASMMQRAEETYGMDDSVPHPINGSKSTRR